jgi:hypothetical protein
MTQRPYGALIAAAGAAALMLTTPASIAGSDAARAAFASTRPMTHGVAPHGFRHHHRLGAFTYWPGYGDDLSGLPSGAPPVDMTPPPSGDVTYTYKYDAPWDWAHRLPPNVAPSNRAYVPSCSDQTVTVPGRGGGMQTVNVTRCY